MNVQPISLEHVDLEVLDAFLESDRAPQDCMQLSDLDGFLTGIAIGPELIMPSEWLPVVWGGEEGPSFADQADRQNDGLCRHPPGWRLRPLR